MAEEIKVTLCVRARIPNKNNMIFTESALKQATEMINAHDAPLPIVPMVKDDEKLSASGAAVPEEVEDQYKILKNESKWRGTIVPKSAVYADGRITVTVQVAEDDLAKLKANELTMGAIYGGLPFIHEGRSIVSTVQDVFGLMIFPRAEDPWSVEPDKKST